MAKKPGPDLLSSRVRAVSGGVKPLNSAGPRVEDFAAPKPVGARRRKSERLSAFKEAILVTQGGVRVKVIIKDLSDTGARVDFHAGGGAIQGRVQLLEPSRGLQRFAQVRWRDQNSAGLEFE